MATTRAALTDGDIRALVRGPTDDERASVAHRICRRIDTDLSEEERTAAEEVLRLLADDAAELVRRALSVTLRTSPHLPRDVAMKLASDVDGVALPVLSFSPVFTDEDLAEIVRASGSLKQLAIAKRETLAETVTDALAGFAGERALEIAIANDNASFSEKGLKTAIDRFADSEGITTAMAYRKVLPLSISERLVDLVTESMREHLVNHHQLFPETAIHITLAAQERATVDLVEEASRTADLAGFVKHLNKENRLTASLLLRALVRGHMPFLEWGIAELSGVAHHRAWLMIHDAGPLGLRAIYERAGLPARLFPAFRAGVDAYHGLQTEGGSVSARLFEERMLQRFLTQPNGAGREDTEYLLEKMDRAIEENHPEPLRLHA